LNRQNENSFVLTTNSADETKGLGEKIGAVLKAGDMAALCGELGSGKTVMVSGMAKGMKIGPSISVTSPTFIILHEYDGETPLYHFDFYRLSKVDEIYDLGFEEYFEGDGICAVEWADKFEDVLEGPVLWIYFNGAGDMKRDIEIRPGRQIMNRWPDIKNSLSV
jgi:tRNA threonylcarbamoyladenosine biosynthesis protein TsaE